MKELGWIFTIWFIGFCFGVGCVNGVWEDKCKSGGIVSRDNVIYQCKPVDMAKVKE